MPRDVVIYPKVHVVVVVVVEKHNFVSLILQQKRENVYNRTKFCELKFKC